MHAVRALGLRLVPDGWLLQTAQPLTATQINAARQVALASGATVETKSGALGLTEISNGATAGGILIAFGVLAMTIGLAVRAQAGVPGAVQSQFPLPGQGAGQQVRARPVPQPGGGGRGAAAG